MTQNTTTKPLFHILIASWLVCSSLHGQPIESKLYEPINLTRAIDKNTRSQNGIPGTNYWQNRSDYRMKIKFDPHSLILSGEEVILYQNNSPYTLRELVFHLFPNYYKKGISRDRDINYLAENEGIIIDRISINGILHDISEAGKKLRIDHTMMILFLKTPLCSKERLSIDISWHYSVTGKAHFRTGAVDSSSFYLAYFYPKISVYDDIDGWNYFKYTGYPEFYHDFGDYDVSITLPQNYIVWATGLLENPTDVFKDKYLKRYQSAFSTDSVVHIIAQEDLVVPGFTLEKPLIEWKFKAENVTDFAFGISNNFLWDATSLVVDKSTGRRAMVDAAYRANSKYFEHVASVARATIQLSSEVIPAVPYPYPKMTVFNGLAYTEYPMMVNLNTQPTYNETVRLTNHEVLHAYFPFYTGCNETKYAWMDEGLVSYLNFLQTSLIDTIEKGRIGGGDSIYYQLIGSDFDLPVLFVSKFLREPAYWWNSYYKPAIFLLNLHDYLGDLPFKRALQEFILRKLI